MNTTVWLSTLTAFLAFLGVALGLLAKWVSDNKGTIVGLIQSIRDIKGRVDQHDKIQGVITSPTGAVNTTLGRTSLPEPISLSSDVLHETPDRPRVGQVINPHDTANAILNAQLPPK